MKDRHAVAIIAVLIALLFADVLFFGTNFYVRDLFSYHFPMKHVVREIIARGEFPSWNPYWASGQPLAANPAYEIFYPPQWLIFIGSYTYGFALHVLFHVFLAAIGAYVFFRIQSLRIAASIFGALSFSLSGFFLGTSTNLPTFFVWSWAGWVAWAALRVMRGGRLAVSSLIFAMPILVGEPVSLLQMFGLTIALTRSKRVLAALGIAVLIAAVQIVPAIDHAHDSVRSRGFSYEAVTDYSLPPLRILELAVPFFDAPTTVGSHRTHYFLTLYCGIVVLILLIAGLATRQRGWQTVLAILGISFLLAMGNFTPLWRVLYAIGPHSIRYPEKFIAMGLVASIAFATFVLDRSSQRVGAVAIAILLLDLGYVSTRVMPRNPGSMFTPPPQALRGATIFHRGEWTQRDIAARFDHASTFLTTRDGLRPYTPAAWDMRTVLEADFDETDLLPTHDLLDAMQRAGNGGDRYWSEKFMDIAGAEYVVDYNPAGNPVSPITIRRVAGHGRYWFPASGTVTRVVETSNAADLDVEAQGLGLLIINITRHKYWTATLDGRPVDLRPTNIAYQSVLVPAGRHHIALRYANPLIAVGAALSGLGIVIAALTARR